MKHVPVNININPAGNGWVIFVTPKFISNSGDRCYVASSQEELEQVIGYLGLNLDPVAPHVSLKWPHNTDSTGDTYDEETLHA